MEEIRIFDNPQFGRVRTAGTSDSPLFCLADVCKALELRQGDVVRRLTDGVVSTQPIVDNLGREQKANFVDEDGLYDVILDSRKTEARSFRKWITSEVLPSIRKTGQYGNFPVSTTFSQALMLAAKQQEQIEEQKKVIEAKDRKIAEDAPKVTGKGQSYFVNKYLKGMCTLDFTK